MINLETSLGDAYDPLNPFSFASAINMDEGKENLDVKLSLLDEMGVQKIILSDNLLDIAEGLKPLFARDISLGLAFCLPKLEAKLNLKNLNKDISSKTTVSTALFCYENNSNLYIKNQKLFGQIKLVLVHKNAPYLICVSEANHHKTYLMPSTILPENSLSEAKLVGIRAAPLKHLCLPRQGIKLSDALYDSKSLPISYLQRRLILIHAGLGALQTALSATLNFASNRKLYGKLVSDIPHARTSIICAWLDMQLATKLSQSFLQLSSSEKTFNDYLHTMHHLTQRSLQTLCVILGARFYLRETSFAIFQKILRDLPYLTKPLTSRSQSANLRLIDCPPDLLIQAKAQANLPLLTSHFNMPMHPFMINLCLSSLPELAEGEPLYSRLEAGYQLRNIKADSLFDQLQKESPLQKES